VEPKYFDDEREKKQKRKEAKEAKQKSGTKRKANGTLALPAAKRQARSGLDKENVAPVLRTATDSEIARTDGLQHSRERSPDVSDESGDDHDGLGDMFAERRDVYRASKGSRTGQTT